MDNIELRGYLIDLVSDFLYYDRKEDEDLPVGKIEDMIKSGDYSVDWICNTFKELFIDAIDES